VTSCKRIRPASVGKMIADKNKKRITSDFGYGWIAGFRLGPL
jgi:hypothetical protein